MKKILLSYLLTIILLIIVFLIIENKLFFHLRNIDWQDLVVSIIFSLSLYSLSGYQYYLVRKRYNLLITRFDIILLPIVMNLWSFILPFQGSLLFTTIYFKKRYGLKISSNLSIYIYLFVFTLVLSGFVGCIFFLFTDLNYLSLGILSLICMLLPFFFPIFQKLFDAFPNPKSLWLSKVKVLINQTITTVNELWKNKNLAINITCINFIRMIIQTFWFYWIAQTLQIPISISVSLMISLISNIFIIIKFTPDNLGINQLLTGALSEYLGIHAQDGVVISLFTSVTTMTIIFTIGIIANFYYLKSCNFFKLYKENIS